MKEASKYTTFFTGIVLLALVCADVFVWIRISSDTTKSFEEVKHEFLLTFPAFLRNTILITVLNIGLAGIAGYLFILSRSSPDLKIAATILAAGCFLICFWQAFSLM